ncbi:MAG: NAD(P)H-dependent oxidoreductase [Mogibacterium sp.]|nr:NAD(P)H-dependent oxidoreductase [Mogibacterium sp.]
MILVIYYSRSGQNYFGGEIVDLERGNSEQVAEFIAEAVGADTFEIRPARSYPEDYNECTDVARKELRENKRPHLKEYLKDISVYDKVFVVGPCWWGTYPMAMYTQLEKLDFRGKKVLPVMTHEGSGMGSAERDLKKICRGAKIARGLAIQGSKVPDSQQTVAEWAVKNTR